MIATAGLVTVLRISLTGTWYLCDTRQLLNFPVLVSSSINRGRSKAYRVVWELNWLTHVTQFELCLADNGHSALENSFLFITIPVITTVITISFFILGPCVTSTWTCSTFVRPWGGHRSLLWCTIYTQVVGWGGRVTFVHQSYVGIMVAPWDDDVLGQISLS